MSARRPAARRLPLRLAALAGAAALAAAGCTSSPQQSSAGTAGAGFVTGKGGVGTAAPGHRQKAPDISGPTLTGGHVALSDYRGKVVVVNVWGSWCSPCRAEAPGLERVWKEYRSKGVQFLGINTRDYGTQNGRAFEQHFGITYPSLYDPSGDQILRFPRGALNPQFIPSTLVIDRHGRIAARAIKALTDDELRAMVKPIVQERQ